MLTRLPLLEAASLAALVVSLAALAQRRVPTLASIVAAVCAVSAPMIARALARKSRDPNALGAIARITVACASLASATLVGGLTVAPRMHALRTITAALTMGLLIALQARSVRNPGAWIAAALMSTLSAIALLVPDGVFALAMPTLVATLGALALARWLRAPSPDHRARAAMDTMGLTTMLGLFAITVTQPSAPFAPALASAIAPVIAITLALGHTALAPQRAESWLRAFASAAVALAAGAVLSMHLPAWATVLVTAAVATAAHGSLRDLWRALPSGRIAIGARAGLDALAGQSTREDVIRAVLDPLRDPTDVRIVAELWLLSTAQRASLDVAGNVRMSVLALESERALLAALRARSGEAVYADEQRWLRAERADAPAIAAALDGHSAFVAVGGFARDSLGVVLVLPRANRAEAPEWLERDALTALARRAAAAIESAQELENARVLVTDAQAQQALAAAQCDQAQRALSVALGRVARAPSIERISGTLETVWVGYSAPMRTLDARLHAAALHDRPWVILCSAGGPRASTLWRLHGHSPRAGAPCVVLDASGVHPRDALAALFGSAAMDDGEVQFPAQSGVLELAGEGTLGLFDAHALGPEALARLTVALREGLAQREGESLRYPVRARVVFFLREPPMACGFPSELCALFEGEPAQVPSLAARHEDLETRVLFGIDRACRLWSREPLGISREALDALRAWPFVGDERELDAALEHAARIARGARIAVDDLPGTMSAGVISSHGHSIRPPGGAEAETYDALERRILEAALERASGNKSEAARALGLARSTFLDKLKRHGLRV
ncbi:MAG: helix-turn-helix domain-containing protein [Deltaproteobacteria bacterium]|nr:helix-turn-helix domain-containing protein [Deltaproteobacteria bacterium]